MSAEQFFGGAQSREQELQMLADLQTTNRQLTGQLESSNGARATAEGALRGALMGNDGANGGLPDPAGTSQAMPDPVESPLEFEKYIQTVREDGLRMRDDIRQDTHDTLQRNALWVEFQERHPKLAASVNLVQTAFREVTHGTADPLPTTQEGVNKIIEDVAKQVRTYYPDGAPDAKPSAAAAGGEPTPMDPKPFSDPLPNSLDPNEPDRTAGIAGGSSSASGAAPQSEAEETESLVVQLQKIRTEDPAMMPFTG